MNFKTKAFGFVAGTALALSVASGAMAEGTKVTLVENPTGVCTAVVSEAEADFGTYTWNGTAYVPNSGAGTSVLNLTVSQNVGPDEVCDVSVSGTNLTSGSYTIPVGSISIAHGSLAAQTLTGTSTLLMDGVVGAQVANLSLATPGVNLGEGVYTGTITFTAAQGS